MVRGAGTRAGGARRRARGDRDRDVRRRSARRCARHRVSSLVTVCSSETASSAGSGPSGSALSGTGSDPSGGSSAWVSTGSSGCSVKSSAVSRRRSSRVGSVASLRRHACRPTACSKRLREKRPLPKAEVRGVAWRMWPHAGAGLGRQLVVGARGDRVEDGEQLLVGVVVELDRRRESACQAGVLADEARPSGRDSRRR